MNQEAAPTAPRAWPAWLLALPLAWALWVFLHYFRSLGRALPGLPQLFAAPGPDPGLAVRWGVWLGSAWILVCSAALVGMVLAWGIRLRRWLGLEAGNDWLGLSLAYGLGILGFDFLWLGTGVAHLWDAPLLGGLLAAGAGVALWDGVRAWRAGAFLLPRWPGEHRWLTATALVYFLLALGLGLAPETFYDSMVYHLAIPSDWLMRHGILDCPTNFFSDYPYGGELYFLNGLFAQGTEAAKCLHAAAFFFCALAVGGWAREAAGPGAGWLALGLVLTLPLMALNAATTQVEGVLALFCVLMLHALWKAFGPDARGGAWPFAAGILAGGALSVKYTAAVALGAGLLSLGRGLFRPGAVRAWAAWGAGLFLVLGPWWVKNACFTGDPLFPYASHLFGGRMLAEPGYSRLLAEQHGFQAVGGWGWLALPWRLIMGNPDDYNFTGPLALAAAPFLFFRRFRHPLPGFWVRTCLFYFIAALAFTHILRFMAPAFVLFAAPTAVFFAGSGGRWSRGFSWGAALVACLCFFYLASIAAFYDGCAGIWRGKETRAQYLSDPGRITPYASMARWVSATLAPDARLLVVGDARGLYYGRPFLTNSVFDEQVLARAARDSRDAWGIRESLRRLGVTHLVVNGLEGLRVAPDYGHYDLSPGAWARLDAFFQTWTQKVYDGNLQEVFALRPESEGPGAWNGEPMPLLFFTGPGRAVWEDDRRQDWAALSNDLRGALALYPGCVFWHEQEAVAAWRLGRARGAEELFARAARLGPLTPAGYLAWARDARSLGDAAGSVRVWARAKRLYPVLKDVQP